ncbi:MAG: HAD family hydrolase [Lachnospiraceae bacterium]|nr:HAD family hydrolase [Lachnospiraceae bacterium]
MQLVIFDFDGTILDTREAIVYAKQKSMEELGLEIMDEEACAETIGLSSKLAFQRMYPGLSEDMIDKCVSSYRKYFEEAKDKKPPLLFPGVSDTLKEMKRRDIILTIATSRNKRSLSAFLLKNEISAYFSYLLGAEDTELLKPNPDPVLKTLSDMGIDKKDALVVGDMPYDILMGKNAGVLTCGVSYGNSSVDKLRNAGADFIVNGFWEILEII